MGAMTNRNPCRGKWVLVLVAVVVLTGCQTQTEEIEELEKTNGSTELGDAKDRKAEQLRQAADQGDAEAQYKLGVRYAEGDGVPQDHREAVKWYRLAAEQALAEAQDNLGRMYARGDGVPEDYVKADVWLNLAAAQGNGNAVKGKDLIRPIMTSEQVAESQRLAAELFRRIESSKSE